MGGGRNRPSGKRCYFFLRVLGLLNIYKLDGETNVYEYRKVTIESLAAIEFAGSPRNPSSEGVGTTVPGYPGTTVPPNKTKEKTNEE